MQSTRLNSGSPDQSEWFPPAQTDSTKLAAICSDVSAVDSSKCGKLFPWNVPPGRLIPSLRGLGSVVLLHQNPSRWPETVSRLRPRSCDANEKSPTSGAGGALTSVPPSLAGRFVMDRVHAVKFALHVQRTICSNPSPLHLPVVQQRRSLVRPHVAAFGTRNSSKCQQIRPTHSCSKHPAELSTPQGNRRICPQRCAFGEKWKWTYSVT